MSFGNYHAEAHWRREDDFPGRSASPAPLHLCVRFFLLCLLFAGCDSSGVGRLFLPVQGKVTLDGTALTTGSLVFKPDTAKGNTSAFQPASEIATDGTYNLYTKEKPGAPAGWYKVGVVAEGPASATDPYAPRKSLVAQKYNDPETSGLAVEVVASPAPGAYDLELSK
jgi:hypothetical protein